MDSALDRVRVGVIGYGAIGRPIADALLEGAIPGCALSAVIAQPPLPDEALRLLAPTRQALIEGSDVIVEAAGHGALAEHGPAVIEAGVDLVVMSVGALVDDGLRGRLERADGGRLMISTGAVGGLDTLSAAMLVEPLENVSLTSRKPARGLIGQPGAEGRTEALQNAKTEIEVFAGSARDAVRLFPQSANIAATLALATIGFDRVSVRILGAPEGGPVEHRVSAEGRAGSYEFTFRNRPDATNPRTSAIAPYSAIRALRRLKEHTSIGI